MRQLNVCKAFAHACSMAVIVDAAIPRPGLSSFEKPRKDLDPLGFAALAPLAYEACLCSCKEGTRAAHENRTNWCGCWFRAVRSMRRWGNPGLGSMFLLSLQAACLGYSYERLADPGLEHVMGATGILLRLCGPRGAKYFYDALYMLRPSYLGRLSWAGLPDASQRQDSISIGLEDLASAASLYDIVLRDATRLMELSLGIVLPVLRETQCLAAGVKKVTYLLAWMLDDFLLKRKKGRSFQELWLRAYGGDEEAVKRLYEELGEAGPGAVADIVVNALARRIFESLVIGDSVTLLC